MKLLFLCWKRVDDNYTIVQLIWSEVDSIYTQILKFYVISQKLSSSPSKIIDLDTYPCSDKSSIFTYGSTNLMMVNG